MIDIIKPPAPIDLGSDDPLPGDAPCPTCKGSTYVITGRGAFAGADECPQCVGGEPLSL